MLFFLSFFCRWGSTGIFPRSTSYPSPWFCCYYIIISYYIKLSGLTAVPPFTLRFMHWHTQGRFIRRVVLLSRHWGVLRAVMRTVRKVGTIYKWLYSDEPKPTVATLALYVSRLTLSHLAQWGCYL